MACAEAVIGRLSAVSSMPWRTREARLQVVTAQVTMGQAALLRPHPRARRSWQVYLEAAAAPRCMLPRGGGKSPSSRTCYDAVPTLLSSTYSRVHTIAAWVLALPDVHVAGSGTAEARRRSRLHGTPLRELRSDGSVLKHPQPGITRLQRFRSPQPANCPRPRERRPPAASA